MRKNSVGASFLDVPSTAALRSGTDQDPQEALEHSSQSSSSSSSWWCSIEQPSAASQPSQETQSSYSSYATSATSVQPPRAPTLTPTLGYQSVSDAKLAIPQSSPTHGAKRTASGYIKPSTPKPQTNDGPSPPLSGGRSRSISNELSAQLRVRLSYAMVKVQNGWESCNIEEVEQLASQMTSPLTPRHAAQIQSQREDISQVMSRSRDLNAITSGLGEQVESRYAQRGGSSHPDGETETSSHDAQPTPIYKYTPAASMTQAPTPGAAFPAWIGRKKDFHATPAMKPEAQARSAATPHLSVPTPEEQDAAESLLSMSSPKYSVNVGGRANRTSTRTSSAYASPARSGHNQDSSGSKTQAETGNSDNGLSQAVGSGNIEEVLSHDQQSSSHERKLYTASSESVSPLSRSIQQQYNSPGLYAFPPGPSRITKRSRRIYAEGSDPGEQGA